MKKKTTAQELKRHGIRRITAGENWIKATIDWDPEWTEEC